MSLEDLKLFGVAKATNGDKYYYRMQGANKGDTYELYLEASNLSDEGSYVAFVTLKEVHEYLSNDPTYVLRSVPSDIKETLMWIQGAFDSDSVTWVNDDGGAPQLVGKYIEKRQNGELEIDNIRFPPSGKPMKGGMPHEQARMVRSDIFDGIYSLAKATKRNLHECEERNKKFTCAMLREICMADHAGMRSSEILRRIRSIIGGVEEIGEVSPLPLGSGADGKPEGTHGAAAGAGGGGGARLPALGPGQKIVHKAPKKRGIVNGKRPTGIKIKKDTA